MKKAGKVTGTVVSFSLFSVSAVFLAIMMILTVLINIPYLSTLLDQWVVGYKGGEVDSASRAAGEELAEQIQQEGTILVKNVEGTLPLSKEETPQLSVFGWSSNHWVHSGSGSGQTSKNTVDFLKALDNYGIKYYTGLTDMYKSFQGNREKTDALHSFNFEFNKLYEPSVSNTTYYTPEIKNNAIAYSDTAIVVIGRVSGESNDAPKKQYKKVSSNETNVVDPDRTYLEISTEEEELLTYVGENFDKVIVLINSTSTMELGFLDTIPGIDACLIVGTTGTAAANAIPKILYGEYSPSGRTADTYAYDLSTSSTYVNTGSGIAAGSNVLGETTTNMYTNGAGLYPTKTSHTNGSGNVPYAGVAYVDYVEGIYVGYKWYETADTMGFWDSDLAKRTWNLKNGGYGEVVQFPFGFGLSYTEFEWTVNRAWMPSGSTVTENDEIRFQVTVTNVGKNAGQDVVEVYYNPPYTNGGVEKSSVNLAAFAKTTQVLQPGESETVEVAFKVADMKSYDYNNLSGAVGADGGYVLEEGTYTVSLRTDSHTVATKKIKSGSAEYSYKVSRDIELDKDSETGAEVANRFTGANTTDGVAIDGNSDGSADILYLTRADIENTFPFEQAANREMTQEIKDRNLYTAAMAAAWANDSDEDIVTGATGNDVTVFSGGEITELGYLLGDPANFDDESLWGPVLDSLDWTEMQNVVLHGYVHTMKLTAIGKPQTVDLDGPNQIGSFNPPQGVTTGTGFSSIVLAQTWNVELAYSMGLALATDAANSHVSGWYGPGINLHRSPFGGRNFEYYSEDSYLSGMMAAYAAAAAKNAGVYSYLKHLALYETESGRDGMYTWLTEQALREIYLKPFEIAIKTHEITNGDGTVIRTVGGTTGIMTSYGRIGSTWTGGSAALITEVVRNEWGFKGGILTDYADHRDFMNGDQMVRAGGDLWMDGAGNPGNWQRGFDTSSASFRQAVRNANKHVVFMWLNALATNYSYNADADNVQIITKPAELKFRWYIPVVYGLDGVAVVATGVTLGLAIFFLKKKSKAPVAPETPDAPEAPETFETPEPPASEE